MRIIVASTNPVKINAVQHAFAAMFPDLVATVDGQNPGLDIPAQPMTDRETYDCAAARLNALQAKHPDADYWVAIEGGLDPCVYMTPPAMHCVAWIVVRNRANITGEARTASFPIPHAVAALIQSGVEMGHANDRIFGMNNSKQGWGMTGIVTHGAIDRTAYYTHALTLALAPFKNAEAYAMQTAAA